MARDDADLSVSQDGRFQGSVDLGEVGSVRQAGWDKSTFGRKGWLTTTRRLVKSRVRTSMPSTSEADGTLVDSGPQIIVLGT